MYFLYAELQQAKFGWCFEFEMVRYGWVISKSKNKNDFAAGALRGLKRTSKLRMISKEAERQQKRYSWRL